jgi:2,4-dienoyl-CoA reductase-like NADH-dependent reductase (Old Yellow Enzyme family)
MPGLFDTISLRSVTLRNRIGVSPMCQYVARDGFVNDWHVVHLGSRAVGGAGLVIMEATAVLPEGRISPGDTGLWKQEHVEPLQRLTAFIQEHQAVAGIQLGHAGRKASTAPPADGGAFLLPSQGGWNIKGPDVLPFKPADPAPLKMTGSDIDEVVEAFAKSAKWAVEAGFSFIEIHGAHGYLLHSFHSPLSNRREDDYGGSLENRIRLTCRVIDSVRRVIPDSMPLGLRLSCSDWYPGGWTIEDTVFLAKQVKKLGVDLIDCSSGGGDIRAKYPAGPNWQVQFATEVRKSCEMPTAAVGLITEPVQADAIIRTEQADIVLLGREFLRDPYWPLHAARKLGKDDKMPWPANYCWAL